VVLEPTGATVGSAIEARLRLVAAGFGVVEDRAVQPDVPSTTVLVPDQSDASMAAGRDAAAALGLPAATPVTVDPRSDAVVDIRVVLGPRALPTP
jgi:hypothetical protein